MDRNDRQAIENLFDKLASVERQGPPPDPEAERFIREQVARQPSAAYYMAQTIVVQEQALVQAQARMEELEREAARGSSGGGLLSGLFGGGERPSRSSHEMPRVPRRGGPSAYPPMGGGYAPQGGGFLAGAAQTAMGVAGGVLLGNAIGGMFAGEAEAAEGLPEEPMEEPAADDAGFDDGGGDMEF